MKTLILLIPYLLLNLAFSQNEHPSEHPAKKKQAQEHPSEHPSEHPAKTAVVELTKDNLAEAIHNHITSISQKGFIEVKDEEADKALKLKLLKVHKERLSNVGNDTYFACADFETAKGKVYDLDFFMKGNSADKLKFETMTVHKESGEERYTWFENNGIWVKQKLSK